METTTRKSIMQTVLACLAVSLTVCLAGCGGTKVIDEPQPMVLERPLATTSDQRLQASLDLVIVRNGLGAWAKDADWDEYLIRVRNLSNKPIRITGVAVYDSLGTRLEASANLGKLVSASRETTRRYKSEGIKVKAGASGEALMAAGAVALVGSEALSVAVLTGSVGASAAGLAVGALVLAPVMIVGGTIQSVNKDRVAREIVNRYTPLPVDLVPQGIHSLTMFFPLAPSPRQLELTYEHSNRSHKLTFDTTEILDGLHIGITDENRQHQSTGERR